MKGFPGSTQVRGLPSSWRTAMRPWIFCGWRDHVAGARFSVRSIQGPAEEEIVSKLHDADAGTGQQLGTGTEDLLVGMET